MGKLAEARQTVPAKGAISTLSENKLFCLAIQVVLVSETTYFPLQNNLFSSSKQLKFQKSMRTAHVWAEGDERELCQSANSRHLAEREKSQREAGERAKAALPPCRNNSRSRPLPRGQGSKGA